MTANERAWILGCRLLTGAKTWDATASKNSYLAVRTLVVSVALERVSEEAILLRALRHVVVVTLGCHSHQETQKDVEPGHVGSDVSVTSAHQPVLASVQQEVWAELDWLHSLTPLPPRWTPTITGLTWRNQRDFRTTGNLHMVGIVSSPYLHHRYQAGRLLQYSHLMMTIYHWRWPSAFQLLSPTWRSLSALDIYQPRV